MEFLQQSIDWLVGDPDRFDIFKFEQLITITNFHIREIIVIVVLQRKWVDHLIAREFIRPAVVPAVDIAKENQPVIIVEFNSFRALKYFRKPFVICYDFLKTG